MEQSPRYATLYDYLRVIRRRWLIVVVFTLAAGLAAFAVSKSRPNVYQASTQLAFRDIAADLDLVSGASSSPDITAGTRAAVNAQLITRPGVTNRVAKKLKSTLTPGELAGSVTTQVGVQTNLVTLTAQAGDGAQAAAIANAYSDVVRKVGNRQAQDLLRKLENSAEKDLKQATSVKRPDTLRVGNLQDRLSRIRTLRDVTQPVQIVESAIEPTVPVSPKPPRDTVLGLLLGLTLGVLAAFIRESLDRRVHGAHEAHQELGVPVLGRVSDKALKYPGLAANGSNPINETEFEAFRTLRTNLKALTDQPLQKILVTSGRPEEGKTAVSLSLGSAIAVAGQKVLLVECDLRRPTFARRLGLETSPGLTDYLAGTASPQDILRVVPLTEPGSASGKNGNSPKAAGRLVCIPAGSSAAMPAELLGSDRFAEFLDKVSRAYDTVIIDASPLLAVVDPLELVPLVDGVLMCVRSGQTTRDEVRASRAALSHLPDRPTGAVITGLKRGGSDGYGYYYGY